ncbi:MAG TPA: archaeosortase/exosortase family protein [Adhaeribacter sp.]|nr:archaeosortase/exosortase family protein [Adhaeribacter sp.]
MNDSKQVIKFLATALGLYIAWYLFYDLWMFPDGRLDTWLSLQEVYLSSEVLQLVGYNAGAQGDRLTINGYPVVAVGNPCNAMVLFALFAGFIIAYPGPWKAKLYYIPVGIIAIYLLNVLRIVALALNSFHSRHTLEFNNKYTFAAVVYCCIFLFWMYWVKHYAKPVTEAVPS